MTVSKYLAQKDKEKSSKRGNRWYDYVEHMADAVDCIQASCEEIQQLLANHVATEFKNYKSANKHRNEHLSSGQERVRHMFFSQMHKRWQDKTPQLRQMFVLLAVMREDFLIEFSKRVLMINELIINAERQRKVIELYHIEQCINKPYKLDSFKIRTPR